MNLELATLSLKGLSVGDAFGEMFFGSPRRWIAERKLPPAPCLQIGLWSTSPIAPVHGLLPL